MAQGQRKTEPQRAPKVFEDRVAPEGELTGHLLEPNRTPDRVRFPDPVAPGGTPGEGVGVDSIAEVEMARRTDAGAPVDQSSPNVLWWLVGAAVLILILLALASS